MRIILLALLLSFNIFASGQFAIQQSILSSESQNNLRLSLFVIENLSDSWYYRSYNEFQMNDHVISQHYLMYRLLPDVQLGFGPAYEQFDWVSGYLKFNVIGVINLW